MSLHITRSARKLQYFYMNIW